MRKNLLIILCLFFICQTNYSFGFGYDTNIINVSIIDGETKNGLPLAGINTLYGSSIENLGDINGDGINDIAVGAPKNSGKGAVFIHMMKRDGTLKNTIRLDNYSVNGADYKIGDEYGYQIKNLGDLDSNGINDIAVKSKNKTYVHYLYKLGDIKKTVELKKDVDFPPKSSQYGDISVNIGDLDSNGTDDIAIGDPKKRGKIIIYFLKGGNKKELMCSYNSAYSLDYSRKHKRKYELIHNGKHEYLKVEKTKSVKPEKKIDEIINENNKKNYKLAKNYSKDMSKIEIQGFIYPDNYNKSMDDAIFYKPNILKAEYHRIDNYGNLVLMDEKSWGDGGYSIENIEKLKKLGGEVYTTVSGLRPAVTTFKNNVKKRKEIIEELNSFAIKHKITGVDIDIEQFGVWTVDETKAFIDFLSELGTKLHSNKKKLIVNLPAVSSDLESKWYNLKYQDLNKLSDVIDIYAIMTYDYMFDYGVGEPVQPLDWLGDVIDYAKKHIDNEKISIGINSYGYTGINGQYNPKIITYEQAKKIKNFKSATRDKLSGEMYWNDGANHYRYVDIEGMNIKKDYILSKGINKISVWHLGGNSWFY
ncbi:hypothetical protein CSB08_01230 [Candidatus Gracilibacteria bacterium]|nr:MAG: hypothetical protein CSB08_01230 [Candidatus Gracilibacteria bacterium]PIE85407.1 MAG: hypothetical protein CSA08_02415 [Candidatus Gracilibacteria bacterium]